MAEDSQLPFKAKKMPMFPKKYVMNSEKTPTYPMPFSLMTEKRSLIKNEQKENIGNLSISM